MTKTDKVTGDRIGCAPECLCIECALGGARMTPWEVDQTKAAMTTLNRHGLRLVIQPDPDAGREPGSDIPPLGSAAGWVERTVPLDVLNAPAMTPEAIEAFRNAWPIRKAGPIAPVLRSGDDPLYRAMVNDGIVRDDVPPLRDRMPVYAVHATEVTIPPAPMGDAEAPDARHLQGDECPCDLHAASRKGAL